MGYRGQEVRRLQLALGGLNADGNFGNSTLTALKDYQTQSGLLADGVSGPKTRQSLGIDIYAGIDVSKWNTITDWNKVKSSGQAEFCWIKATEGGDYLCSMYKEHLKSAESVGIPCGSYHFARPDINTDPHREVKNFIKHAHVKPGALRPVLDFEKAGTHSPDSIRDWVLTFLKEFESQSGVRPIIYIGGNMTKYHLRGDTTGIDEYLLWHAYYSKKAFKSGIKKDRLGCWKEWKIWQYTGSGKVKGCSGPIDCNWLVGGPSALKEIKIS